MLLACVAVPLTAQDEDERENLTDLREVNVVVDDLAEDAEAAGLDRRAIQRDVERQLEARGIRLGSSRSAGDLYIDIATFQGATGLYAYCIEVSLQQLVTIEGNQLRTLADVWELGSLGTVGSGNLPQIAGIVTDIVDVFIDDYLDVNPIR